MPSGQNGKDLPRFEIDSLVRSGRNLARAASSQHECDDPNFSISQQYTRFNDSRDFSSPLANHMHNDNGKHAMHIF
jgi:hypothetical protein